MSRLRPKASTEVVQLSYWVFAVWWVIILGIHVITGVYTALFSYSYWTLQYTYLNSYLERFEIGMPPPYHNTIAIVHAIMSALHGICILLMLGGSIWQRSLAFTPWSKCDASAKSTEVKSDRTNSAVLHSFTNVYTKISDRHGFCGVNSDHFHALLMCRELVETALQTVQAYRMSLLLPRMLLNRFYIVLLATNCWSSVVVYSIFFKGDEARRRLASIVLDCAIDVMACMGVELIILLSYAGDYDTGMRGVWDYLWRNDEWAARVLNEFRMVVVVSWSDLASRAVFALGLVMTTTNMKELLQRLPRNRNRVTESTSPSRVHTVTEETWDEKANDAVPDVCAAKAVAKGKLSKQQLLEKINDNYHTTKLRTRGGRLLLRAVHLLFGAWGIAVLGLHIHASVQPTLPQCLMQVRPWAASRPSCYLIGLDCHRLGISGTKDEVATMWSEFDSSTVVQLLISHCPALEVPDSISQFYGLHGVKVYNSTIVDWGESAAFTSTNHPNILSLYIARTNMTDGLLPAGFHALDFPQNLHDFEFCVTNLRMVPEDLDLKWPRKAFIQFEYGNLQDVPSVFLRLEPKYLALTGNPITQVPPEVFEIPGLRTLGLGQMNINELPRNVSPSPTLNSIFLDGTGITFFWPWMDELITMETWGVLVVSLSPYCVDLEKIQSGAAEAFSIPPSSDHAPLLMDPSKANVPPIWYVVSCYPGYAGTYYFITLDDENMAISPAPALVRP